MLLQTSPNERKRSHCCQGHREGEAENPSPSLPARSTPAAEGLCWPLARALQRGGSLRLPWEYRAAAVIPEEPTCALHCAGRRGLHRKPCTGGGGQVQVPTTLQHIHGTGRCIRENCRFPKLRVLAGKSCFIGETLATPSAGALTPGTRHLLTLSPKAVSCSCLGSQH